MTYLGLLQVYPGGQTNAVPLSTTALQNKYDRNNTLILNLFFAFTYYG